MIIECSSCHARYQYDEARFEQKVSKKIRCAKCATIFEIVNPRQTEQVTTAPSPAVAEAAGSRPKSGSAALEQTQNARPKAPAVDEPDVQPDEQPAANTEGELRLPQGQRLSLAIIDGPGAGAVFRLTKPRVTIGRAGADFVISDDEASRQHAAVEVRDTFFVVRDLDSKNGTLVNGVPIEEPTDLQDKAEFVIGGTTIMLIVTQEA